MLDLLVFTQHPSAYAPKHIREEAKKLGLSDESICYNDLKRQGDTLLLPEAKAIILREPDYKKDLYNLRDKILQFYISKKSIILNQDSYSKWSVLDKITQTLEFEKAGIPHIKNLKPEELKCPYIVKNKLGSHGDSVYKVTCKDDLDEVLKKHKIEDLLFQEFQTSGFDLRVIVLNGRVLGIMKRTPREGEFLSNFSQGGRVEQLIVNSEELKIIEQLATKTAKHFKLDYVGVDLMLNNNNEWVVLEVNRACQFKGFEQATGVNIASKVVDFLIQ